MSYELRVIAEAGVNHNGSLSRALDMVDAAVAAGADAIKFQTFSADKLARKDAKLATYQRTSADDARTQWDLLKRLELDHDEFLAIKLRCTEKDIIFLSTGFDLEELDFLVQDLSIPMVKIASGDLTFAPMLVRAGTIGLPVILSTGMSDIEEIKLALQFLAVGFGIHAGLLPTDAIPSREALERVWSNGLIRRVLEEKVTVLHCTTQYPAPKEDLNLNAMVTIAETFELKVGYSDHSMGDLASTIAVTLGATVIEKHFTLDRNLEGPDHAASLEPNELTAFIGTLRDVRAVLGSNVKECQPSERANRAIVRRSLVAALPIEAGRTIAESDVECRRPANGRPASEFWDVVGTVSSRSYEPGDYLE